MCPEAGYATDIQHGWADSVVNPDDTSTTSNEGYGAPETGHISHLMMCLDLSMHKLVIMLHNKFVTQVFVVIFHLSTMNLFHYGHV